MLRFFSLLFFLFPIWMVTANFAQANDNGYFIKTASGKKLQVLLKNRRTDVDKLFNLRGKEVLGIHIKGETMIAIDNGRIVIDARPKHSGSVNIVRRHARSKVVTMRNASKNPVPRVQNTKNHRNGFVSRQQKRGKHSVKFYGKVDNKQRAQGCGAVRYRNGNLYIGNYYRNRRHGKGISFFNKKRSYVLRNDQNGKLAGKRNVPAVKINKTTFYFGETRKQGNRKIPHGFGVMRYKNNRYVSGQYRHGKLIKNGCTFTPKHFR